MVDTKVQDKPIAHPSDSRLLNHAREQLVHAAQVGGIALRQSYARVGKVKRRLKRHNGLKSTIGHIKSDNRQRRNRLKGRLGDAMHAILCGSEHNLRMTLVQLRVLLLEFFGAAAPTVPAPSQPNPQLISFSRRELRCSGRLDKFF